MQILKCAIDFSDRAWSSTYYSLYYAPVMGILQVVLGGLFYYSFPYIIMAVYLLLVTHRLVTEEFIGNKKLLEPDVRL